MAPMASPATAMPARRPKTIARRAHMTRGGYQYGRDGGVAGWAR
jgi:hypothetical protein